MRPIIYLSFLCFLLSACVEDQLTPQVEDCTDTLMEEFELVPFNDETFGCKLYLAAYIWRDRTYYYFGSHCADFVLNPFDCNRFFICEDGSERICDQFFEEATYLGIIAYQE